MLEILHSIGWLSASICWAVPRGPSAGTGCVFLEGTGQKLNCSQIPTIKSTCCNSSHYWDADLDYLIVLISARSPYHKFTTFCFESYWCWWRCVNSLFLIKPLPTDSIFVMTSPWISHLSEGFQCWFFVSVSPSKFITWHSTPRKIYLSLFVCSHLYIGKCSRISFVVNKLKSSTYHYSFWCSNCPLSDQWGILELVLMSFWHIPVTQWTLFWILWHVPCSSHSFPDLLSPFMFRVSFFFLKIMSIEGIQHDILIYITWYAYI